MPDAWQIAHNRGLCFLGAGQFRQAIADAQKALALKPDLWQSAIVLAKSQQAIGLMEEADQAYAAVLRSDPSNPSAILGRAHLALNQFGDPLAASALVEPLLKQDDYLMDAELTQLMASLYDRDPNIDAYTLSANAKRFAQQYLQLPKQLAISKKKNNPSSKRPRVGLLSNAFCTSPVYFLTISGWHHVAKGCDIVIFNRGHTKDWATEVFKSLASEWHEVQHMPGLELANVIADYEIDVLYDLGGWMDPVGLQALSLNPAPQQFKWVGGQSMTTGLNCFAGWIGDEMQSPKQFQDLYTEPLINIPGAYATYTAPSYLPKIATSKSRTPCVFSNPAKISRQFLQHLKSIPGKKIFIHRQYQYARVQERIRLILGNACEFVCPSSHEEALKVLNSHAVMIDTFPYTSGLTAYEANALGVQVQVKRLGQLFCERHTAAYAE
jgi:predicted O-linked N-acetylglucosamine transferase (SPINDLY family)